jgi:hypothetical protein
MGETEEDREPAGQADKATHEKHQTCCSSEANEEIGDNDIAPLPPDNLPSTDSLFLGARCHITLPMKHPRPNGGVGAAFHRVLCIRGPDDIQLIFACTLRKSPGSDDAEIPSPSSSFWARITSYLNFPIQAVLTKILLSLPASFAR